MKQIEVYLNNYHSLESVVLLTLADYLSTKTGNEIVVFEIGDELEGGEQAKTLLSFLQLNICNIYKMERNWITNNKKIGGSIVVEDVSIDVHIHNTKHEKIDFLDYLIKKGYLGCSVKEYCMGLAYPNYTQWRQHNQEKRHTDFPCEIKNFTIDIIHDWNKLTKISRNIIALLSSDSAYKQLLSWAKIYDPELYEIILLHKEQTIKILDIDRNTQRPRKDMNCWSDFKKAYKYFFSKYFQMNYSINPTILPKDFSCSDSTIQKLILRLNSFLDDQESQWIEKFLSIWNEFISSQDKRNSSQILRVFLTLSNEAPDLNSILDILGKKEVITRVIQGLNYFQNNLSHLFIPVTDDVYQLTNKLSCYFIDYWNTSKEFVRYFEDNEQDINQSIQQFSIRTCLRLERYYINSNESIKADMYYVQGSMCVRRLLSVLCGLQSEIVGEIEIYRQIEQGIKSAREKGTIDNSVSSALEELLRVSRLIRKSSEINSIANYSTIAYDIMKKYMNRNAQPVYMIIGAGYMATQFYNYVKEKNCKLIWVNRDVKKIWKTIGSDENNRVIVDELNEYMKYLKVVDGVFIAIKKTPEALKGFELLPADSVVVDISYPSVVDYTGVYHYFNLYNINFNEYSKSYTSYASVEKANQVINAYIDKLNCLLKKI